MVRSGILGGSGHSNFRSEFGSGVFGYSERRRAHSGKVVGHGSGWSLSLCLFNCCLKHPVLNSCLKQLFFSKKTICFIEIVVRVEGYAS